MIKDVAWKKERNRGAQRAQIISNGNNEIEKEGKGNAIARLKEKGKRRNQERLPRSTTASECKGGKGNGRDGLYLTGKRRK